MKGEVVVAEPPVQQINCLGNRRLLVRAKDVVKVEVNVGLELL